METLIIANSDSELTYGVVLRRTRYINNENDTPLLNKTACHIIII